MGETTVDASGVCANGWGTNTTIVSCCWWQPLQAQGAKGQGAGCKGQDQHQARQNGMQQQHATPTTTTTDQLRISTSAGGVHDAAIIATCVGAHNSFHALPLRWWCFSLSRLHRLQFHPRWFHPLQLVPWCFSFHPPAQILTFGQICTVWCWFSIKERAY